MKKPLVSALVLVLTLSVLTGCGCRNSKPAQTAPTTMPTLATVPTTEATVPTTMATTPTTAPTIEDGNGPMPTDETGSTDTTDAARGRNGGVIPGNTGTGTGITGSIG